MMASGGMYVNYWISTSVCVCVWVVNTDVSSILTTVYV